MQYWFGPSFCVFGPSFLGWAFLRLALSHRSLAFLSFSGLALLSRVWPFLLWGWPFLLRGLTLPSQGWPFLLGFFFFLRVGPSFFLGVGSPLSGLALLFLVFALPSLEVWPFLEFCTDIGGGQLWNYTWTTYFESLFSKSYHLHYK